MADIRRNQRNLAQGDWDDLIAVINATHGVKAKAPAYRAFVNLHVDAMSMTHMAAWGVHYMSGPLSNGRNFLAWHRRFVRQLELRLQREKAGVTIPYWDWVSDRALPMAISAPALLSSWSVTRSWNPSPLPTATDVTAVMAIADFATFQLAVEHLHDRVHVAVGGNMDTSASPSDPAFSFTTQTSTACESSGNRHILKGRRRIPTRSSSVRQSRALKCRRSSTLLSWATHMRNP
jgi:mitochondrial fission protein ELM1